MINYEDELFNNIKYASGRFFIDVASSGCGSSCTYCYVQDADKPQILIDKLTLIKSLNYVKDSSNYVSGKYGSIISLCPNTEPFKSEESTHLIISVLKYFLPLGNPIQISTKESIPTKVLELSQNYSIYEKQVFFNISTSSITKASLIEPSASPINIRLENINRIKNYSKLTSCLYIKPFTPTTSKDIDNYIELINISNPNFICIGIDFKKNTILDSPCDLLYHDKEIVSKALDDNVERKLLEFSQKIKNTIHIPIFHSSVCIIANSVHSASKLNIKSIAPALCDQCSCCNS